MGVVVGSRDQAAEYAEMIRKQNDFMIDVCAAALIVVMITAAAVWYAFSVGAF